VLERGTGLTAKKGRGRGLVVLREGDGYVRARRQGEGLRAREVGGHIEGSGSISRDA